MKLFIVCGAGYVAGKEIMTLELTKGLQARGHDLQVMASSWNNRDFPTRLRSAGLRCNLLPLGFISATLRWDPIRMTYGQIIRWPELLLYYGRHLDSFVPKRVIHTNWHHLLLLWPYLRASRDLFWLHDVVPNNSHYRVVFRGLARRLSCFVAVSQAVGESLRRIGIPERKILVIHNGLDDPAKGFEKERILEGTVNIGIVGQIGPWKGHEDLLNAFKQIVTQCPGAQLHIFGKGSAPYESYLREQALMMGVAAKVTWHGFLENRADIFKRMDICIVPSRAEEALPTVAIEAAAFGLPVIATHRGGLPEIVEHGVTGMLVPPNSPDKLADAISRLLADPGLRSAMGEKARERMLNYFSKERFMTQFLQVLQTQN